MAKKKIEANEPERIEALKSGEIKVGMSTLNTMNQTQERLINLVYALDARVTKLEAKKG